MKMKMIEMLLYSLFSAFGVDEYVQIECSCYVWMLVWLFASILVMILVMSLIRDSC